MSDLRPKVGVGLLLMKGGQALFGMRKGSHGEGLYGGTGGHMEQGETFEDCVYRELAEEAGTDIKIKNLRFLCIINFRDHLPKHYIDIGFTADWMSGEPKVVEPEYREGWDWFDIENPPSPIFGVLPKYIEAYKTGKTFFDD